MEIELCCTDENWLMLKILCNFIWTVPIWKRRLTKQRFLQQVSGTFCKQQQILSHKSALSVLIWKWTPLICLQVARKFSPLGTLESQKLSIFHLLHSKLSTLYLEKYTQNGYFVLCGVHGKSANMFIQNQHNIWFQEYVPLWWESVVLPVEYAP